MPTIDFKGKTAVQYHHLAVPHHQLVPQKDKSLTDTVSLHDNLIIQGDNLLALKALLPTYGGKVKCIYIDPPYNTGNEGWVYNDKVNSPIIKDWIGKTVGKEGEDLTRHDKWLCMMLPRLKLLRELLADNGTILISIDDIEQARLKLLLDEVFGEPEFVATLIWKSRQIVDSRNQNMTSTDHEYVIAYGKSAGIKFRGKPSDKTKYTNPDNDERGPWMSNSILGLATKEQRPNLHYDVKDPSTGAIYACPEDTGWRYSRDTMQAKIDDGRIVFPKKSDGRPREKKFLSELASEFTGFSSLLSTDVGYTLNGTREVRDIFGEEIFAFPKPSSLIKTLLQQVTGSGDIILDSFAGSGTTAQAVLELNKEDSGSRKFILVEMEDYANDITAERVRRVIKGVPVARNPLVKEGLGGTFSYFKLGDAIELQSLLSGKNLPNWYDMARYVFYTASGNEFDDKVVSEAKGLAGKTDDIYVYVYYRPDLKWLKDYKFTLAAAEKLRADSGTSKHIVVYAPAKYIDNKSLDELNMSFCQLPYEIYELDRQ